ncbi:reverse transcriptase domain-containing protein, partial [Tanacetum coccineum]
EEDVTTTPSPTTTSSFPTPPNAPSKTPSTNQTSLSQENTSSSFQSKLQISPPSSNEPTSPQPLTLFLTTFWMFLLDRQTLNHFKVILLSNGKYYIITRQAYDVSDFYQETSTDTECDEGSEDTCEDLNSPYKGPKPTPFTLRITHFKYHQRAKHPRNIRTYEGNKDLEDHLSIFSATAEQEEWPMQIWCKMFRQTLGGATRIWFDDLDPQSVDSFVELSQKFLEEFSQQKRYAKDPTEIHSIKRRQNESLQNFMDRFKPKSSHIKRVPLVLCISAFMHGHCHSKHAKKLNDKIPKTVDEMFERVRAFIRGEMAVGSVKMVHPFQGDKGNTRRPEDKRGQETEMDQRTCEKIYEYIHLIPEGILSLH